MKNTGKNSYFFLPVSFVVTILLVGTPAYAQDKTSEIDKLKVQTTEKGMSVVPLRLYFKGSKVKAEIAG